MNTIRDLRRRIKSATNIEHITSAMQKVSAARLNKARQRISAVRPYADTLEDMALDLVAEYNLRDHPLFKKNTSTGMLVVAIASDKGLCGSYNSAVANQVDALVAQNAGLAVSVLACGKKIRDHCRRKGIPLYGEHVNTPVFFKFRFAREIANTIMDAYQHDQFSQVILVYTRFISPSTQEPYAKKLLPFSFGDESACRLSCNFLHEPGPQAILHGLVPSSIRTRVWEAMLESSASEHALRMMMMEQASINADKMITELIQTANRLRQSLITKELSEIVGTSEALK